MGLICHDNTQHLNACVYIYDLLPGFLQRMQNSDTVALALGTCLINADYGQSVCEVLSMHMSTSRITSGGIDIKGGLSAHRQAELEGKLIEALKHIWVIVHLDSNLVQVGFEGWQIMRTQKFQT